MVNHGLSTGALFLLVGMIYDRRHTREIADYGGIAKVMPVMATLFLISSLASIGLPGLNGFIGEFLILNGSFSSHLYSNKTFDVNPITLFLLTAIYMFLLYMRLFFSSMTIAEI